MSDEKQESSSILTWLTVIAFLIAMVAIFVYAPTEQTEGAVQRIMYFHIPAAWLAFLLFLLFFSPVFFFCGKRKESGTYMPWPPLKSVLFFVR